MTYTLDERIYDNLFTLGKEMYLDSDLFAQELRRGTLLSFIQSLDKEKYERIQKLTLQALPNDVFVYEASYILNPFMSLRIKNRKFDTYEELGKAMLSTSPKADPILLELVKYGLISPQMKRTFFDAEHRGLYLKIVDLEETAEKSLLESYFSIAYALYPGKKIIYNGVEYKDLVNLCYFLCKSEKDLSSLGASFSSSPLLKAYHKAFPEEMDLDTYFHLCNQADLQKEKLDAFLKKRKEKEL